VHGRRILHDHGRSAADSRSAASTAQGDDGSVTEPRIEAVAFDVNETLFSLDRMQAAFADVGVEPELVPLWFARLLRDGFALTALGGYRPFAELAAETLRGLVPTIDADAAAGVASAMRQLQPHPDVEPALRALHDAGLPVATLTNGSVDTVRAMLDGAGLTRYVPHNLSVDAVRRWKPAPEPYRYAAGQLGVEPRALVLVASHPWDCAGAQAAGLSAAWINRSPAGWPAFFAPPQFSASDLTSLTDALLATRQLATS